MSTPRDVDELASALLDGLLDAEAAAAAGRDPEVAARAAEMRAAREALRRVPPPDPARRDDAIAAALDAAGSLGPDAWHPTTPGGRRHVGPPSLTPLDPAATGGLDAPTTPPPAGQGDSPAAAGPPPAASDPSAGPGTEPWRRPTAAHGRSGAGDSRGVVPLGRRRRWADPRWLGAAAVIVLVVALGALLAGQSSDDDSTDSAAGGPASSMEGSEPGDAGAGSEGAGSAESESGGDTGAAATDDAAPQAGSDQPDERAPEAAQDQPTGTVAGTAVELGAVDSGEDLAERVRSALDELAARSDTNQSTGGRGGPACADPLAGSDDRPLLLRGRAVLDGKPVDVWVHADGGSRRMVATDTSCAVVDDRLVPG